jgi:hypothetical protein
MISIPLKARRESVARVVLYPATEMDKRALNCSTPFATTR